LRGLKSKQGLSPLAPLTLTIGPRPTKFQENGAQHIHFETSYIRPRDMTHSSQILHGGKLDELFIMKRRGVVRGSIYIDPNQPNPPNN